MTDRFAHCLLSFLLALCPVGLASAATAPRPIRVLLTAQPGQTDAAREICHGLMENLGRDAIHFDFAGESAVDEERRSHYDLIIDPAQVPDVATFRARMTKDVAAATITAWQSFLSKREPEVREANPWVANYEKRPEAITYQQPFSAKGSMERTQVPADMRLELFACEPDIRKPIAMAWDERGRCWVAETSDYPHGVEASGEGHDSIKICEDTNGDGRADKFTVFADKLNIPTGIVFANGGIIISQPPRFLFLKDTNGDDIADVRQVVMDAWGVKDTHAQASSLHYGFDNWIHGCVGYSGFKGTVGGKDWEFSMGTYRFKPDGSALEFLHQFSNNAWGHSQNRAGDNFGGTANGAPLFYGGIPAMAWPQNERGITARKINDSDKVHAITPNYRQVDVFGGYTAAAGSSFIDSANLPPRLQGMAMICEPTMKVISLLDVKAKGAGYVATDAMNLVASTDEWMSPVFAEVGPDGAVWFADWQNFIIQHNPTPSVERGGFKGTTGVGGAHENPLRDHVRGRIYRVVWDKATPPAITTLQNAGAAQLLAALRSDNQFWRLKAQQIIVEGTMQSMAEDLRAFVVSAEGNPGAIHALWSLQGLGRLDEPTTQAALLAKDPALRRNAIRTLGSDDKSRAALFGSGVIHDPDLITRCAAWVKLADFPTTPEIKTLVISLNNDPLTAQDEWLADAAKLLSKRHGAIPFREGPNLLPNPGFEELAASGLPLGWTRRDYGGATKPGNAGAEWKVLTNPEAAHSGKQTVRCITRADGDTSLFADVVLKPKTRYRLSAWVRAHGFKGKISLNDHIGRAETTKVSSKSGWTEVEVVFNSKERTKASINLLHVGKGDGFFDDVKLCEYLPITPADEQTLAGDPSRGENIFWKHPVAACMNCHILGGKGSPVGPALDGIASRKDEAYLTESLINPNARLAEGYTATPVSPMPPMNLILKPQELADIKAFLLSLRER